MKTIQSTLLVFIFLLPGTISDGQAISPQEENGKYYFQVANVYFEVDPSIGARISSFKIDDEEILQQSAYAGDYLYGATLWQSPQSEWNWPPSVELDQNPYTGGIEGTQVILRSAVDETYSHLVFKKVFSASLSDTSVSMEYTMINKGTSDHSYSAWELARVPSGGISFFPKGEGDVTGDFAAQTELINGIVWYQQDDADPSSRKFFCDGAEGWSAHVNDDLNVFIKQFEDAAATDHAPGESEIELWYSGPSSYIELENQSAYTNIAVGDSVTWNMKWYLRNVPSGIQAQTGNADLVNYIRNIVNNQIPDALDNLTGSGMNLYPNPAREYVMVNNLPSGKAMLIVIDLCGTVLYAKKISNEERVPLTGLKSGIYLYQLTGPGIKESGKLSVIR